MSTQPRPSERAPGGNGRKAPQKKVTVKSLQRMKQDERLNDTVSRPRCRA